MSGRGKYLGRAHLPHVIGVRELMILKQGSALTWLDNWLAIYLDNHIACHDARQGTPCRQQACLGCCRVGHDCLDDCALVDPELPCHSLRGHLHSAQLSC